MLLGDLDELVFLNTYTGTDRSLIGRVDNLNNNLERLVVSMAGSGCAALNNLIANTHLLT